MLKSLTMYQGASNKIDNNPRAYRAKVAIRQHVLDAIGHDAAVFDGSGEMFSAVWRQARAYTGCDLKRQTDGRLMYCADKTCVLHVVDLGKFDIFDFDAYGSPRHQAVILSERRRVAPGETVGLVLTGGGGLC